MRSSDLIAKSASNTPYWGAGKFDFAGMDRMIAAQKIVGALTGDVDWSKIVDHAVPAGRSEAGTLKLLAVAFTQPPRQDRPAASP